MSNLQFDLRAGWPRQYSNQERPFVPLAALNPTKRDMSTARYSCPITDSTTASCRIIWVKASSPLEPMVVRAERLKKSASVNFASLSEVVRAVDSGDTKIEAGESK